MDIDNLQCNGQGYSVRLCQERQVGDVMLLGTLISFPPTRQVRHFFFRRQVRAPRAWEPIPVADLDQNELREVFGFDLGVLNACHDENEQSAHLEAMALEIEGCSMEPVLG